MKTRVIAWVVVLGLGLVGWHFVSKWRNPWVVAVPVTAVMPAMPGCSKECAQ